MRTVKSGLFGILLFQVSFSQYFTISGYVKDSITGEALIGASVYIQETMSGTTTNNYGFYALKVPAGKYTLIVSFIGYKKLLKELEVKSNIQINVQLPPSQVELSEITVSGEAPDKNVRDVNLGKVDLSMEQVKSLPVLFGETDILKTIQLLPGVKPAAEGSVGYFVRGGNADQNLVLLDETIVYNPAHLLGFFSVFTAEAVNNFTLWKGDIPARFGGRLSSVLDIALREGSMNKFGLTVGIGTLSSYAVLEGPIKKEKASFIVSARRAYLDLFMKMFIKPQSRLYGSAYYFGDYTAKVNFNLNESNRLYLALYYGRDNFSFVRNDWGFRIDIPWGNFTGALRWNHQFSSSVFSTMTASFSDFEFDFKGTSGDFKTQFLNKITTYALKWDIYYVPHPLHKMRSGLIAMYHIFKPSQFSNTVRDSVVISSGINYYGFESAIYTEDEWDINTNLSASIGVRLSQYSFIGPFKRYYTERTGEILDSIVYKRGEFIKTYILPEPRVMLRYMVSHNFSIKGAFSLVNQYLHNVTYSSMMLPTDSWVPVTEKLKPQTGWQTSLGFYKNLLNNTIESFIEFYYREMKNVADYSEGALPEQVINNNIDNLFSQGRGWAYGTEFLLKKSKGKVTGWLGYTLSRSLRHFADINNGRNFPATHDRIHNLSFVLTYNISKRLSTSAVFVYYTGDALTMPVALYVINGNIVYEYSGKNEVRAPDYHRLDLSLVYKSNPEKKLKWELNFSIYNVYSRLNPYFIFIRQEGKLQDGWIKFTPVLVSLYPILPSFFFKISI